MSFPSLFLQMELASPCRIYIHHFRDFSSLYCCRLLLECLIQYDFASWPFCFIALQAVMPASFLQCYFYSPKQSLAVFLASMEPLSLLVLESLYSRHLAWLSKADFWIRIYFLCGLERGTGAGFLIRYRWLISPPLTTCKHLLCMFFQHEFQLPGLSCLCQVMMHHASQSPGLCFQQLPCVLGGSWWFAAA